MQDLWQRASNYAAAMDMPEAVAPILHTQAAQYIGLFLTELLLNHLSVSLDQGQLPESQYGFRKDSGTSDMVFTVYFLQ